MKNKILMSALVLYGVLLWTSLASAQGTGACSVPGGFSILSCDSCTAEQYTEVVPKLERRACPPGFMGFIETTWDETWDHDVICEAVGVGTCGQAHFCDPVHGWTRMALPGPFTEEVQIDHATKIGHGPYHVTNFCVPRPKPVMPEWWETP